MRPMGRAGTARLVRRPVRRPRPGDQIRAVRERPSPRDHRRAVAGDRARHAGPARPGRAATRHRQAAGRMIHPTTTACRWGGHPAKWLAGFIPDVPTPFDASGAIDLAAFVHLCERQITAGATALVIGETAGETSTLTSAERTLLIRTATETSDKRVHVNASAGSNATGRAVELTRQAAAAGADAIMSVVPHYNRPKQEGNYAHFCVVGRRPHCRSSCT